ncbi:MAG: hypothetical protein LBD18_02390 [Treponema sp.]|jgi:hypothetical protein|nr:hypothetical protein [Treponema sp.]
MGGESREWGARPNPGPLHLLFIRAEGGGGGNIIISGGTVYATGVSAGTGSGNGAALATVTVNNKPIIFASSINNRPSSDLPNGILVGSDVDLGSSLISFLTFPATATLTVPPNMNFKLLNTGGKTLANDGIIDLNGMVTINHAGNTLLNKNTINIHRRHTGKLHRYSSQQRHNQQKWRYYHRRCGRSGAPSTHKPNPPQPLPQAERLES